MDDFVKQLMDEQGIPKDLDPEIRAEIVKEITEQANDYLNLRLIDAMTDEDAEKFADMLEGGNAHEHAVQAFVAEHVPNVDITVANALIDFRTLYLGTKA